MILLFKLKVCTTALQYFFVLKTRNVVIMEMRSQCNKKKKR